MVLQPTPAAAGAPPAPSVPAEAAGPSTADIVRLEIRVEELERRLKARTMELETEIRSKERLRSRVEELTVRADEIQATASAIHREAVSATALSRELDETLRVASEARRQLGEALAAERARREAAEASAADAQTQAAAAKAALEAARNSGPGEAETKRRDSELKEARLHLQALRQKVDGHEAHIESLRTELEQARTQARIDAAAASGARERAEAELQAARDKMRDALANAEKIRREGVEAFENARDLKLRSEQESLDALRQELKDRAERESKELRDALEAERARMYADLDAERRTRTVAPSAADEAAERVRRLRAESEGRRRGIEAEVEGYLAPPPPAPAKAPVEDPREPAEREPWQVSDEMKLAVWVTVGVVIVLILVAAGLVVQG